MTDLRIDLTAPPAGLHERRPATGRAPRARRARAATGRRGAATAQPDGGGLATRYIDLDLPTLLAPEVAAAQAARTRRLPLLRAVRPWGPVFSGRRADMAQLEPGTLTRLLSGWDRLGIAALTVAWAVAVTTFWVWLLEPGHRVTTPGLVVNGALLAYLTILPAYFLIASNRMLGVSQDLPVPALRVAFVVTKAPSEPWPVARRTLEAMLDQRFPHPYDVWLCDEDPTDEVVDWCLQTGAYLSSRRGVAGYHSTHWPRRTKCKEGNLAYFYDRWGYAYYDVVAQLDCDHVPAPSYLAEMVRPFADPAVGYVGAPSVCDSNADQSWAARGRLYCEASFHGPFQTGHHGLAPVCIGSHYAVRTAALHEVGGVGPELAEDFSTSFLLTSAGWSGAFAHRAQARGEGPHTFSALLTQEFQWSRSLVTLLFDLVPSHLPRLPLKLQVRYLFALLYYPLLVLTTAGGLLLPPIAAVTGIAWLDVNYFEFLLRWTVLSALLVPITLILRRRGLLRPVDAPVISWETWLYVLVRWPYVARGVSAAVLQKLRPRPVGFAVTPKTRDGLERLTARLMAPYLAIAAGLTAAALVGEYTTNTAGYVFLCLVGSATYTLVVLTVCLLHARESAAVTGISTLRAIRATVAAPFCLGLALLIPFCSAAARYPDYLFRVLGW